MNRLICYDGRVFFLGSFDYLEVFNKINSEDSKLDYVYAGCDFAGAPNASFSSKLLDLLEVELLFGLVEISQCSLVSEFLLSEH